MKVYNLTKHTMTPQQLIAACLLAAATNASACLDYSDAWKWGLRGLSWDDLVGDPCAPITERQLYMAWDEAFGLGLDDDD